MFAAPQGLEQGIAKTHGEQVLDRWLTEVMVNTEYLAFTEAAQHRFVDGTVGGQIMTQGLLQDDADMGCVEPVGC